MTRTNADPHPRTAPAAPVMPAEPWPQERVRVVLEAARAVVERGWLQHGWYRTAPRSWRSKLFGPIPTPETLDAACLVAAVAVAGHSGGALTQIDRDSGPALDLLWESLQDQHGRPVTGDGAVAPIVRRARMRELVRWNDAEGRTRDDVLGLIDRAASRSILDQVRTPAPG